MGDIPPKWNRKEPMCFSFLSLSGSEIVERLFNKIPQMSVPRTPLPKYVAKNGVKERVALRSSQAAGDRCFGMRY
jgi:hypothetical protein